MECLFIEAVFFSFVKLNRWFVVCNESAVCSNKEKVKLEGFDILDFGTLSSGNKRVYTDSHELILSPFVLAVRARNTSLVIPFSGSSSSSESRTRQATGCLT